MVARIARRRPGPGAAAGLWRRCWPAGSGSANARVRAGELGGQRIEGLVKALACRAVLVRYGAAERASGRSGRPNLGAVIDRWSVVENGAAGVN